MPDPDNEYKPRHMKSQLTAFEEALERDAEADDEKRRTYMAGDDQH